jgi:peroxiredoxin
LPEHSRELIQRRNLTFEILTDRGNKVAAQLGIRWQLPEYLREVYRAFPLDLPGFNGDDSWTVPIPSRFIIDRKGIIRSVQSDPDYTTRPEPSETLDALGALITHP